MSPTSSESHVPRWGCFEQTLTSTVVYDNPFQEATLRVTFRSPSGRTRALDGFWDGGSRWRIRFAPDESGSWTYQTSCSDTTNAGLHSQIGTLTCGEPSGSTPYEKHGPLRLSNNGHYLEHADGTPFLWLADTVWNGPLRTSMPEWERYVAQRARQKFTALQWVPTQWLAEPKGDITGTPAYTDLERIRVNPTFFQRHDDKIRVMNRAGLLSVPVLLWAAHWSTPEVNASNPGFSLPEDQAIRLARYMVARWGAYFMAWILPGDGDYRGERADRWKRIGRAVFGDGPHAPVSLHPGGMQWNMAEFGDEPWLDIAGYQSGHGDDVPTLDWLTGGPPAIDWKRTPARAVINLEPPYENHLAYQSRQPHSPHSVRRALYWSLLVSPTAGVTYGGHGVWGWDDGSGPPTGHPNAGTPLPWQQALTMPGAEQLQYLSSLFQSIDWWRLCPAPELLATQPGGERFIAASRTEDGDLTMIYTPDEGAIQLRSDAFPDDVSALWFDPRTGQRQSARLDSSGDTVTAQTPGQGDWVLLLGRNVYLPASSAGATA